MQQATTASNVCKKGQMCLIRIAAKGARSERRWIPTLMSQSKADPDAATEYLIKAITFYQEAQEKTGDE